MPPRSRNRQTDAAYDIPNVGEACSGRFAPTGQLLASAADCRMFRSVLDDWRRDRPDASVRIRRWIGAWLQFSDLPDDILAVIISVSNVRDIVRCMRTCRYLYDLWNSDDVWYMLCVRDSPKPLSETNWQLQLARFLSMGTFSHPRYLPAERFRLLQILTSPIKHLLLPRHQWSQQRHRRRHRHRLRRCRSAVCGRACTNI